MGTVNFVIAGLLPAIAHDLQVTRPVAGQLVTAFALTFVAGRLSDRYPPERVLAAALLGAIILLCGGPVMTWSLAPALVWAPLWDCLPAFRSFRSSIASAPAASSVLPGKNSGAGYLASPPAVPWGR